MNDHTVRPSHELIRICAQRAAAAPDAAIRAIEGARGLLPDEVLWLAQEQDPSRIQIGLEAAAAHRATIRKDKLRWDPGMERLGRNLLVIVGSVPEIRNLALQRERQALEELRFTPLQWKLVLLLGNAARIDVLRRGVLSRQILELFQQQRNFEAGRRLYRGTTKELWIKARSAAISVELKARGNLAALKFRWRRWSLPPGLGSELLPQLKALIGQ